MQNSVAPSTPASGYTDIYIDTADKLAKQIDDAGVITKLAGGGDVIGPSSAKNNAITRYDTTTGKLLQDSDIYLDDISANKIYIYPAQAATATTVYISGGSTSVSGNDGGGVVIEGRQGGLTGAGGDALVQGGLGGATSGNGGVARLHGGNASGGNSNGGAVTIKPGAKAGAGANGVIALYTFDGSSDYVILDNSNITGTKTATFPNRTGILALNETNTDGFNTYRGNINDDSVVSFTPPYQNGVIVISLQVDGGTYGGIVNFTAQSGGTASTTKWAGGANLNVTTGILTGTTGSDAKVTVSAATDGKIYLENRIGNVRSFGYTVLANN